MTETGATETTRNPLARTGFGLVLAGVLLPVAALVVGIVAAALEAPGGDDLGWAILGGLVFAAIGLGLAVPFAVAGVVLCIVAVTRRGRAKAMAIVGIVLGAPLVLIGLGAAPVLLDVVFPGR